MTVFVSAGLGFLAARNERRLPLLRSASGDSNKRVAQGLIVTAAIGVVAAIAIVGNPVAWLDDRIDEFRTAGTPDLSAESTRFSFNAGSNRYDAWRVALDDAGDDPLFGDGAGGYQYSYLRKREAATQELQDAHSVEFELLAELGVIGLGLFCVAVVAGGIGVLRARRLGPSAAGLAAIALASGSYWLVHVSVDWFWPYPAITAPVIALIGSACAPAVLAPGRRSTRRWRGWLIAALAVFVISAIPPLLAERFVNNAYASWRTDPSRAYADLERARQLNPLSDLPLLAEGAIARAEGDRERALEAFAEAARIRPEEFATHYLLAELQQDSDRLVARNEIRVALELNPLSEPVLELAAELGVDPASLSIEGG